jgi:thiosulfate dehydrogenase
MAGGLPLNTPFGPVYSANITPDKTAGIGHYTFDQFDRAMRKGVTADGRHLYPAMPYPSFAKVSGQDMRDLYACLMQGVQPVAQANKASGIKWPFNMRWGLALWNWTFLDSTPFKPNAQRDAAWNRGAYLVQGLGHCGACHTPRGIGFQEKALSEAGRKGALYLSGEQVESWNASNLRDLWTENDLVALFKTGQNPYGTAAGGMTDGNLHEHIF